MKYENKIPYTLGQIQVSRLLLGQDDLLLIFLTFFLDQGAIDTTKIIYRTITMKDHGYELTFIVSKEV